MRRSLRGHHDPVVRLALLRPIGGAAPPDAAAIAFADIFGLGEDGAVTVTTDAADFVGGDYTNFTLDTGVTLTGAADRPTLIRATGTITINGTIDNSALISIESLNMPLVGVNIWAQPGDGGGGGGNDGGPGQDGFLSLEVTDPSQIAELTIFVFKPVGFTPPTIGAAGAPGLGGPDSTAGSPATPGAPSALGTALPSFSDLQRIRTGIVIEQYVGGTPGAFGVIGGNGGNGAPIVGGPAGGDGGDPTVGGNGGASIYLVAPSIVFGAGATLRSNGGNGNPGGAGSPGTTGGGGDGAGGGGGGASGSQGGSGGIIGVFYGTTLAGGVTTSFLGGTGGAGGAAGAGGPAGGETAGGAGAAGQAGADGAPGFVFLRQIGHK